MVGTGNRDGKDVESGSGGRPRREHIPVAVEPDYRVFALFALLNRYGYDLEGNPEMHPVRVRVREALAGVPSLAAELGFCRLARPFYPRVGLMEAFALLQDGWPADGPGAGGRFANAGTVAFERWLGTIASELPQAVDAGFVARLPEMGEVLAGFEARTPIGELWWAHTPDHLHRREEMAAAVVRGLHLAESVLGLSGWPFRRVRVVTNLLQSEWLADQLIIGDQLTGIVASADPSLAPSVLHEALHLVFRPPLAGEQVRDVLCRWQGRTEPIRENMEPQGYWGPDAATGLYRAVQESLVRAAAIVIQQQGDDAKGSALPIRRQVERGFELVRPFAAYLARDSDPLDPARLAAALDEALCGLLAGHRTT